MTLSIVESCKKYDEGPFLSLKSKNNRIIGDWDSEKYYIDDSLQEGTGSIFYNFEEKMNYQRVFEFGTWKFDDKKEKILLTLDINNSYALTILRLTNEELWTSNIINDKTYEYHFIKKTE
jgi:hypothetical protein